MKRQRRSFHLRLEPEVFAIIERLANADRRKLQQQVEMMCEDWLKERGKLPLRDREGVGG